MAKFGKVKSDKIAHDIAIKARNEWIRKAAKLRVEAQQTELDGDIFKSKAAKAKAKANADDLRADADAAEKLAREWTSKAHNALYPVTEAQVRNMIDRLPEKQAEAITAHYDAEAHIRPAFRVAMFNECVDALELEELLR
jgi:DNA-directed RNA polymerase specialized sigma24 family protein